MKPYYEHAGIQIFHGDCREILPGLWGRNFDFYQEYQTESCMMGAHHVCDAPDCPCDCHETLTPLLVADPPYGLNFDSNWESSWTALAGDECTSLRDWLLANMPCKDAFVFGTWKLPRPKCRQILIWDKGANSGMGDLSFPWKNSFEEIYVFGSIFRGPRDEAILRGHRVYTWESGPAHDGNGRLHPTEKPLSLVKYLLSRALDANLVIDPCMGSGTTLEAAKLLGKSAIGIEIEEKYCEIAAKRLSQEVLQFG